MSRKSMTGLIRLHKWQLDEKRRNMGELEKMRSELLHHLQGLQDELAAEQKMAAASSIVSINYGSYAQQVMVRRENLKKSIGEVEVSIEEMKDQVAEAFKELKKYQVVEQRELDRQLADRNMRQQNELDEMAINMHRRRQKLG